MSILVTSNHSEEYYFVKKVSVLVGGREGGGGPPLPHFPKYFPHYANNTSAHATGECGTLGKSESPTNFRA